MASTDDDINCDDAQTVGEKIQEGLNGVCVQEADVKITPDAVATSSAESFLRNSNNNEQLIN